MFTLTSGILDWPVKDSDIQEIWGRFILSSGIIDWSILRTDVLGRGSYRGTFGNVYTDSGNYNWPIKERCVTGKQTRNLEQVCSGHLGPPNSKVAMSRRASALEAFRHNPTDGSFAPPADRPSTCTKCPNLRFLSYWAGLLSRLQVISRVKLTCLTTV